MNPTMNPTKPLKVVVVFKPLAGETTCFVVFSFPETCMVCGLSLCQRNIVQEDLLHHLGYTATVDILLDALQVRVHGHHVVIPCGTWLVFV